MTIDDKLDRIADRLERMEQRWNELLVKRPTQKQQAAKLGIHPVTLCRRLKRARRELMANGRTR